jgi:hypothetical protein
MAERDKGYTRLRRRLEIRYGPEEPQFIGFSGNVSKTGIMIRTTRVYPPGTILHIEVKHPSGTFRVRGQVRWARQGGVQWLSTGKVGMGIKLIDPPQEFIEAVRGHGQT